MDSIPILKGAGWGQGTQPSGGAPLDLTSVPHTHTHTHARLHTQEGKRKKEKTRYISRINEQE